jgi:rod shape-determining protein MreC
VVLTSGLGGVFPRGIPIGTVVGLAGEAKGWERTYLVRPAIHPAALSHVMILIAMRGSGSDIRGAFQADSVRP